MSFSGEARYIRRGEIDPARRDRSGERERGRAFPAREELFRRGIDFPAKMETFSGKK
jgi:hypothetical protein